MSAAMSAQKEPSSQEEWDEVVKNHWENTRYTREREDGQRNHEYATTQDQIRTKLVGLYDQKTQVQQELASIMGLIQQNERLQETIAQKFEDEQTDLTNRRREEDLAQQEWFARSRENATLKESTRPKSSGNRRQSNRDLAPPLPNGAANGAANGAGWTSINGTRRRGRREDEEEPPVDPGNLLSSIYHNPVDDSLNGRAMPLRSSTNRMRPGPTHNGVAGEGDANTQEGYPVNRLKDRPIKPKQRHSLPSLPVGRSPNGKPAGSESASEAKTKSPSARRSLPSAKGSAPPQQSPTPAPSSNMEDITRDRLVLKDDGHFMTEPPMFAGIPLERIDEHHPYWDPKWESLEGIIQPQLDRWRERLELVKQQPDVVRHTVFLANRQVNRGLAIMDFLRDGQWHPFQFVSKEIVNDIYKTFINYDTIFRLVNVHEELKKFDLDMTPLDWLRQRMYDLAASEGDKFNISKVIHDMYHDALLKHLRVKNGYGNIGRPSGYKLHEKDPAKAAEKAAAKAAKAAKKEAMGSVRRKARRSIGQVDHDDTPSLDGIQKGTEQMHQEFLEPVTPRLQKRQRLEPAPVKVEEPEDDNLEYDGWTSTDSFSAGRIMHLDWRVYQIKTRDLTTSTEVTQYWTWKQDKNLFEHQVLRDVFPKVTWGFYQKPIDFNLALEEIKEIRYAPDSQKIIVSVKDEERGDILAYFKRVRTKKRFLTFTKKKGVKLVKSTGLELENIWDTTESRQLPNEDSDT
ncbi:hypothetical protein F4821DRAFT_259169 [Hypoxylon rubiginosum]|uniref:Uncharacterized protein n=1 Tax=Hypoxylon rubiginosum TaxID=110542 RepID=A0ACC0D3A3_9PEZI|nr:hypothetical protein F4821DRAFT_259169 [Hypoxylon rubiginosum]